jgi:molecular chaperone DnaK (HSP70)
VVAIGAAVQANILAGRQKDMLLLDVIPLSLGIETMGGITSKIIHRNSTIPVSASETFSTHVDGQVSVDIHVLQGERELVKDNRSLARFQLKGIPPLPAGIPKIQVEFIVDANGILQVKAEELRTGVATSVQVNPSYGLTDQEVEKMLLSSFENAEKDFEDRFLAEAKVEAETIALATRKSLNKGSELLTPTEIEAIESALVALEKAITGGFKNEIKAQMEVVDTLTRPFAENLLNHSVRQALVEKNALEIQP